MDLNPGVITDAARAEVIVTRLRGIRDNAEWIKWMRNEETYKFSADENAQPIRLMDYDELDNNDFLATNQFWVDGGDHRIRTDVLLFVNGMGMLFEHNSRNDYGRIVARVYPHENAVSFYLIIRMPQSAD